MLVTSPPFFFFNASDQTWTISACISCSALNHILLLWAVGGLVSLLIGWSQVLLLWLVVGLFNCIQRHFGLWYDLACYACCILLKNRKSCAVCILLLTRVPPGVVYSFSYKHSPLRVISHTLIQIWAHTSNCWGLTKKVLVSLQALNLAPNTLNNKEWFSGWASFLFPSDKQISNQSSGIQ